MQYKRSLTLTTSILLIFALVIGSTLADFAWTSQKAHASLESDMKDLEREIKDLEQQQKDASELRKEYQKKLEQLQAEERQKQNELNTILSDIQYTVKEISEKEEEIEETKEQARIAALELKEAEERVEERERLIRERMRSMYESGGSVSYLEVLLGSSSIGDFLQRLDFLSLIMQKDQQIFEVFVEEQLEVERKKEEIEAFLVVLDEQLEELDQLHKKLQAQENQKRVQIASLQQEQEEIEKIDAEMQEQVKQLAAEQSRKVAAKQEIQAELKRIEEERKRAEEERKRQQQGSGGGGGSVSNGELAWPTPGHFRITSHFGWRTHPIRGTRHLHSGTDIGAPRGAAIVAAESGVVIFAGRQGSYGNLVIIQHDSSGSLQTYYAHIRDGGILVREGQMVQRGQKIAEVGMTGASTGYHLHFEVRVNGNPVNPLPYIR